MEAKLLNQARAEIDKIDAELIKLLQLRFEYATIARLARAYSGDTLSRDEGREREILSKLHRADCPLVTMSLIRTIWSAIFRATDDASR